MHVVVRELCLKNIEFPGRDGLVPFQHDTELRRGIGGRRHRASSLRHPLGRAFSTSLKRARPGFHCSLEKLVGTQIRKQIRVRSLSEAQMRSTCSALMPLFRATTVQRATPGPGSKIRGSFVLPSHHALLSVYAMESMTRTFGIPMLFHALTARPL